MVGCIDLNHFHYFDEPMNFSIVLETATDATDFFFLRSYTWNPQTTKYRRQDVAA